MARPRPRQSVCSIHICRHCEYGKCLCACCRWFLHTLSHCGAGNQHLHSGQFWKNRVQTYILFFKNIIEVKVKSEPKQESTKFLQFSMIEQVFFRLSITCTRQNCNFFNLVKIWQPILCWFICFEFVNLTLFCQFCKSKQKQLIFSDYP